MWLCQLFLSMALVTSRASSLFLTADRDVSNLNQWAKENGVSFAQGIGLKSTGDDESNFGVGLVEPRSLSTGDIVMSVPKSLVLGSEIQLDQMKKVAELEPALELLESTGFGKHTAEFVLFLKILQEYHNGPSGLWYPWLLSLPRSFNTGVCMTDKELSCLPTYSRALAEFERTKFKSYCKAAHLLQAAWIPDKESPLLLWAYNVVYTRCWKFSDELESGESEIVPLGDMFNHREPANIFVLTSQDSDEVKFVYQGDDKHFEHEFDELFLSYGLNNPHRFLVIFGFVDDAMPEVFSQIVFPTPSEQMISLGCADRSKMVYRTEDGAIANAVWDTILYAILAASPDEQSQFYHAHENGDKETKSRIHEKYALEASLTLRNHVTRTVLELETLMEEIDQLDLLLHNRVEIIRKQNSFLRAVFERVKSRLDDVVRIEKTKRIEGR